jgi:hypothetical protein
MKRILVNFLPSVTNFLLSITFVGLFAAVEGILSLRFTCINFYIIWVVWENRLVLKSFLHSLYTT